MTKRSGLKKGFYRHARGNGVCLKCITLWRECTDREEKNENSVENEENRMRDGDKKTGLLRSEDDPGARGIYELNTLL